jgi:hypothetical protein
MFSELGDLLEPRQREISPVQLATIQCMRRWGRAGLIGDDDVINTNVSLADEQIWILYSAVTWDSDNDEEYEVAGDED